MGKEYFDDDELKFKQKTFADEDEDDDDDDNRDEDKMTESVGRRNYTDGDEEYSNILGNSRGYRAQDVNFDDDEDDDDEEEDNDRDIDDGDDDDNADENDTKSRDSHYRVTDQDEDEEGEDHQNEVLTQRTPNRGADSVNTKVADAVDGVSQNMLDYLRQNLELTLSCEVGSVQLSLNDLLNYKVGTTVNFIPDLQNVKLKINAVTVGFGEIVEVNGRYGIKITKILSVLDSIVS